MTWAPVDVEEDSPVDSGACKDPFIEQMVSPGSVTPVDAPVDAPDHTFSSAAISTRAENAMG
jgi:hypothetical protein